MSINLYNISEEYKYLLDRLFCEETGEINQDIAKRLDELEKPLQEKAINKVRYLKSIEAEAAAIESERKAMQAREKSLKTKIAWLKSDLLAAMEKSAINEISCPQFVIRLKKNPKSVDTYNIDEIPDEYCVFEKKPVKDAIRLAIDGGIEIHGARIVQNNRIEIK